MVGNKKQKNRRKNYEIAYDILKTCQKEGSENEFSTTNLAQLLMCSKQSIRNAIDLLKYFELVEIKGEISTQEKYDRIAINKKGMAVMTGEVSDYADKYKEMLEWIKKEKRCEVDSHVWLKALEYYYDYLKGKKELFEMDGKIDPNAPKILSMEELDDFTDNVLPQMVVTEHWDEKNHRKFKKLAVYRSGI